MNLGFPAGLVTALAMAALAAYGLGLSGAALMPWLVTVVGALTGAMVARTIASDRGEDRGAPLWLWTLVVAGATAALIWPTWPALLPPGGASDLTHHLVLVDVIERTRHLVVGTGLEGLLGEMAHYTPGFHLLTVIAGSVAGVHADRAAYPLLVLTIAMKWGFLSLIAYDAVGERAGRIPLALAAVGLVLFAPRAFSLDGFLQAGFFAQVAAELFVVAGWWALARWAIDRRTVWMAVVGLMGAAVFLVWPIFVGPLMVAVAMTALAAAGLSIIDRAWAVAWGVIPTAVVAAVHLSQHAAWLRLAGTSGAVPVFVPGALGWLLIALAFAGAAGGFRGASRSVTIWFSAGIVLQGITLYLLARSRGAATPYMAIKMIYLGIYPAAVFGAVGLARVIDSSRLPRVATSWTATAAIVALGVRTAIAAPLPPPIVDVDLGEAGRWARANVPPACVDYLVDNAEQAYWLHLAVMGQPRASPRTAALDDYTANRAIGRWIEGRTAPYAIARRSLIPAELRRDTESVREFGSAEVIHRVGVACLSSD